MCIFNGILAHGTRSAFCILSGAAVLFLTGCFGVAPFGSTANPETRFEINPLTHKIVYEDNAGRELHAKNVEFSRDSNATTFKADALDITTESTEIRLANVAQKAQDTALADTIGSKIVDALHVLAPAIQQGMVKSGREFSMNPTTGAFGVTETPAAIVPTPPPQPDADIIFMIRMLAEQVAATNARLDKLTPTSQPTTQPVTP